MLGKGPAGFKHVAGFHCVASYNQSQYGEIAFSVSGFSAAVE